jgi:hypothetical protein
MADYSNQMAFLASVPMTQQKRTTEQQRQRHVLRGDGPGVGRSLDRQANAIVQKSDALTAGDDSPAAVTALTTEALKMSFLSNSSHTSISSVGQALETSGAQAVSPS